MELRGAVALVTGASRGVGERLTTGVADDVRSYGIAVNCFRIDVPIASEGFVCNAPELTDLRREHGVVAHSRLRR